MALIFVCESAGNDPFPPGVFVTITSGATDALVGTGWTLADGSVGIAVAGALPYIATFSSSQVQARAVRFVGNALPDADTVVVVPGASAPLHSGDGMALALTDELPALWFDPSEYAPGGGAWAICRGAAGGLAAMDGSIARLLASQRLQTAVGDDDNLDAWVYDHFGGNVRRYPGEQNATLYARAMALITGDRRTLAALQAAVVAFYTATLPERLAAAQPNLAFDLTGSFDGSGGYDLTNPPPNVAALTPSVSVWDADSQPALAAQYGIDTPRFVVRVGFTGAARAWYLDSAALDIDAFLLDSGVTQTSTTAPDPRLAEMIAIVKAPGTRPVYQYFAS